MKSILVAFLGILVVISLIFGLGTAVSITNILWKLAGAVLAISMGLGVICAIFEDDEESIVEKTKTAVMCAVLMLVGIFMIFTNLL